MTALRRCFSTAFQVKHKNLQDQKLFYSLHVILVEDSEVIKISLTLLGLLGEDVAVVSVLPLDFSRSGKREALFGTGAGLKFHFSHFLFLRKIEYLLGRAGGQEHHHAAAFQLRLLINHSLAFQRLCKALLHINTQTGVRHFAAAEPDGNLYLVALLQELCGLVDLGVKVVGINVERKADLLQLDHFLVFLGFLFLFLHLKTVLAVIENFADRGLGLGSHLDQVQIQRLRHFQRIAGAHNALLLAVRANQADFLITDLLIDFQFLGIAVARDWNTPPLQVLKD